MSDQTLATRTLAQWSQPELRQALDRGLVLDLGAASLSITSRSRALAQQLAAVYAHFPIANASEAWADFHIQINRPANWRRWLRPQVVFRCDQEVPFEPFPANAALPLLEWGSNWLIGQRFNQYLLFHAGTVERHGRVLLMPALPGSGKSTLTAALAHAGFRLFSDEFGVLHRRTRVFYPLLKPIALKNQSIEVFSKIFPQALIGPSFPGTRKGTVAHVGAAPEHIARRHETAPLGGVILPRWQAASDFRLQAIAPQQVFPQLSFNAFNYALGGRDAFLAASELAQTTPAWQLDYSELSDAVARIRQLWDDLYGPSRAGATP